MSLLSSLVPNYPLGLSLVDTNDAAHDANWAALANYLFTKGHMVVRAVAADVTYTTSTTLTTILSFPVLPAGSLWAFEGILILTCGGTGGLKVAVTADATLSATAFAISIQVPTSATAVSSATATSLGTAAGASSGGAITGLPVFFSGILSVNVAGAPLIQTAQNSSNSTSTVKVGSFVSFTQVVQ